MEKPGKFAVRFRYVLFGVFAAMLIVSLLLLPKVQANYDIASYLPDDMETRKALTAIEDEWGMNSFLSVMVEDVSADEARSLSQTLSDLPDVLMATFDANSDRHYKDGNALIKLTVSGGDFSDTAQSAVRAVENALRAGGYTYYTAGSAVDGARMQNGIGGEMTLIMVISVAIVVAILLLSSRSWFEPIIFLLVVGAAILINLGTNFFLGEISYITKSVAAILQLALAMDYSIVLLHNYDAFVEKGESSRDAAAHALNVSIKPIVSSSLTTVAGLVALMFMSFGIGLDIGLVMSKGILISMLTVFFCMPGLLVLFGKPLKKCKHRPLPLGGAKLAAGAVKARFVLPVLLICLIAAGAVMQSFNTYSFSEVQPSADRDKIEAAFASDSTMIVLVPRAQTSEDYEKQDLLVQKVSALKKGEETPFLSAQTYNSTLLSYPPLLRPLIENTVSRLFNGTEHSRLIFSFDLPQADDAAFRYIDAIKTELDALYGANNTCMAGGVMTNYDISKSFGGDLLITNLITILSILLIIGLTFRSFSLPVVLVLIIQGPIWAAMSVSFLLSEPIFFMSYLIASAILMGATIDYAILITDRYMHARKTKSRLAALQDALTSGMVTVLTSGLILTIAGFVVGGISSSTAVSTIGLLLGRGAVAAIVLVLVLLPELLYLLDKPIQKTSFGTVFCKDSPLANSTTEQTDMCALPEQADIFTVSTEPTATPVISHEQSATCALPEQTATPVISTEAEGVAEKSRKQE